MRRIQQGSVCLDRRIKQWNFFWWEGGKRRSKKIGSKTEFPTKSSAWKAAQALRIAVENRTQVVPDEPAKPSTPIISTLVDAYRVERMPKRLDTRRSYETWLSNYIVPRWGECKITDVQPRPVQLWLESLPLSPKSKSDIRCLLRVLFDYAMWSGQLPINRNPMELVRVQGATKRTRDPRSLTPAEFQQFIAKLADPFRTIALVSVCCGLRASEALGLRWSDIDWLEGKVKIQRGVVNGHTDEVKTVGSKKALRLSADLLDALKLWRAGSQFKAEDDWVFASPVALGRKPWSYANVRREYVKAALKAGIGPLATHSLRHTFRSWMDANGTPLSVQQKAMRHSSIKTTMDQYGDVIPEELALAFEKVSALALAGANGR